MIKEGKLGLHEAVCLTTIVITSNVFYTSPGFLMHILGTISWCSALISAATAAIGFTIICLLLKRYPGKNIIEIFNITVGRYMGFIFSIICFLSLALFATTTLREFIDVLKDYAFPLSATSYLVVIFVATVLILCRLGIEAIARFAKLSAYALLLGLILVLILAAQNYNLGRMFPLFGYGIGKTMLNGFKRSSLFGEVIILAVIARSLQGTKHIKKAGYISIVISGILISATLFCFTITFPYYTGQEITSPMYELTALINYGVFIQRLDPIFLFAWCISSFIAITTLWYISLSTYCKAFKMQDMKPLLLTSGIILFTLTMLPRDITEVSMGYIQFFREYAWIVFFILPLIALISSLIRRKGVKANA
ncbi:MAG TPA: GerAB/ArcD/ProY family transporter [Pseudobacteroides sp.]|uniref:GerAB/ArcD/ProY family transporter n=1 Tax=Pseudobacteroides sp. TaxID=1968840 RepID=UPI002F91ECE1